MNKTEPKAIIFDIDGTLINTTTKKLSPVMLETLFALREKGIKLFIASGRHKQLIDHVFDGVFEFDGTVELNGSHVTAKNEVIYEAFIDPNDVKKALARAEKRDCLFVFFTPQTIYTNRELTDGDYQTTILTLPHSSDLSQIDVNSVCQMNMYVEKQECDDFMASLARTEQTRWSPRFADLIPKGSGKGKGIRELCDYHGIRLYDTLAFGDGENDIPMFYAAGHSVAMGGASELVRASADEQTGTVEEEGITCYLKEKGIL